MRNKPASVKDTYLTNRIHFLEKNIANMQKYLNKAPEGGLVCRQTHDGKYRYYSNIREKQKYIPEHAMILAKKLALKKLYTKACTAARQEIEALRRISPLYGKYETCIAEFFENNPGCASLIRELNRPIKAEIADRIEKWEKSEYRKNPLYPEYLTFDTIKGEKVRSKSEAFIADVLYLTRIPYRYECELIIGDEIFYPDFMIMDPETGEIYIWEHFGLIEMDNYLQRTANKMRSYTKAGYFPNKNFIITSEDELHPFTGAQAAEIVSRMFHRIISAQI